MVTPTMAPAKPPEETGPAEAFTTAMDDIFVEMGTTFRTFLTPTQSSLLYIHALRPFAAGEWKEWCDPDPDSENES
jgi:hypothetical protein